MIKNLSYGTTNNKKKWCIKPLFVLLFMFACFFCSFSVYNVNAETLDNSVTLVDGSMIHIQGDDNVRDYICTSAGQYYFDCSYRVTLRNSSFNSSSAYDYLLENKPDISLNGIILNKMIDGINYAYKFDFLGFDKFTYCDNVESADTFNYVLGSYKDYLYTNLYVTFLLPFDFVISYDYDSSITHSLTGNLTESLTGSLSDILCIDNTYATTGLTFSNIPELSLKSSTSFRPYSYNGGVYAIDYYSYSLYSPSYNVSFYDYDNTLISSQSIVLNDYAEIPSINERVGYDFIGWSSSLDGVDVLSPITCDVSFTATYKIKTYNVIYKDYNGNIISSQTINYGSSSSIPNSPSRVGYTFNNWLSSVNGIDVNSPITQNVEFTATYTINKYNVRFIGYDGVVLSDFTCDYGSYVNTPSVPSVVGYTFNTWLSNNDNITIDSPITDNVVFTADYTKNIYVVNFYDENGALIKSLNIEHGLKISSSDIPSVDKPGYSFINWSSSVSSLTIDSQILSDVGFTKTYEIIPEFWEGVEYAKNENYETGFNDGVSSVDESLYYNDGYTKGYSDGYGVGYNQGESDGLNSDTTFGSLMYSIIDAPFNVLSNAFNFEIFGINLSYFLIAIVSLLLVFFVIRKLM